MTLYAYHGVGPTLPDDGSAWVAPSADLIGDVRLGAGASVWFGAVVRADNTPIIIGEQSNIQDLAVLHSDASAPLTIGNGVTIGHKVILHGCTIGDNVLIGMGAIILNNAIIPDNCLVGAGALVTEGKTFPPGSLIVGSPAQAKRDLSENMIEKLRFSASSYAARQREFSSYLKKLD